MTCEKFESVIGYHCSPVLMGNETGESCFFFQREDAGAAGDHFGL